MAVEAKGNTRLRAVKAGPRAKKAPEQLNGRALEVFGELEHDLELSGRLKPEFLPLFRLFCQSLAVAEAAGATMNGVETEGRSDKRTADPAWRGFRDATALAFQLGREYGLTPASATTVKMPMATDEEAARLLA